MVKINIKKYKLKILDRYMISELTGPFVLGIVGFVMVMITDLLFTFTDLIINKGVPFFAVLQLMFYKLPSIMVLTFPVSVLFSTAMALGRLAKDNELVALRTSGINLYRIAAPILIVSVLVSVVSYITNEKIVPYSNNKSQGIIRQIIMKKPMIDVKENVFFKDAHDRYYYVKRVDYKNNLLEGIMIYELLSDRYPRMITAQKASFSDLVWHLQDGVMHEYDKEGRLSYEGGFAEMSICVNEDICNISDQKTTEEMNSGELNSIIGMLNKSGVDTNALKTDLFMKISIPITCFIFALIAIPLSIPSIRVGRTWGVILSIVIVFTFYVFASVFRSLGRGGILPPVLAAFFPQILFAVLGVILLFKEGSTK